MRAEGQFSWTDISLPDPEAGKAFYAGLFGWEGEEQFDPDGNYIYTMFSLGGRHVAGMGPQMPGQAESGIPPMWNSYINVSDVDATLARVEEAGGKIVMPAMDVMAAGRMSFAADPTGGVFALWQAGEHHGAGVFNEPGAMTWNELATRDVESAKGFYQQALGWDYERFDGPMEYWVIEIEGKVDGDEDADDDYNGGILSMDDTWPAELPAHWMVYFQVADTDAAGERVKELGGKVVVEPFDTPAGKIAVVNDSQGGTFSIISPPTDLVV